MKIDNSIDASGTSFHGSTVPCSFAILRNILGEPAPGCSKTQYNWYGKINDHVFTVYDWKMGEFGENVMIDWHIGGLNKEITESARNAILEKLLG